MFFLLSLLKRSFYIANYDDLNVKERRNLYFSMSLHSAILYALTDLLSSHAMVYTRMGLYLLSGLFFFIDTVYFSHYHALPSVAEIPLAFLSADGATGSVKELLSPWYFLYIIDIPFYFIFPNSTYTLEMAFHHLRLATLPGALWLYLVVGEIVLEIIVHFERRTYLLKNRELFVFHLTDIFSALIPKKKIPLSHEELMRYKRTVPHTEWTGKARGKNLIVIQFESLEAFPLGKTVGGVEITPTLNALMKRPGSVYFPRYYQMISKGNTADAEFSTNHSLYPSDYFPSYFLYRTVKFNGLPKLLHAKGYDTRVFHGNRKDFYNRDKIYPKIGFAKYHSIETFENPKRLGLAMDDADFFRQSAPVVIEQHKSGRPFYDFLITVTSHHPYDLPEETHVLPKDPRVGDGIFSRYLNAIAYADRALGELLQELEDAGVLDDTVLAIYGDHYGISANKEEERASAERFLGYAYTPREMMNIPLLLLFPDDVPHREIKKVGSQLDFYPTMLDLFGAGNKKRLLFGENLFHENEGFVAPMAYVPRGSFIIDRGAFILGADENFENGWFQAFENESPIGEAEKRAYYERALRETDDCTRLLENSIEEKRRIHNEGSHDRRGAYRL